MRTRFSGFWALFAMILLVSAKETGCRKTPAFGLGKPATEQKKPSFLLEKLKVQAPKGLNAISAKAQISLEYDGPSMSANANIIWIRDSIVWLNVRKFGIEAIRALITKDSIFVLNRLEKTFSAQGLESLQRQYNLPEGFQLIQKTILGQPWLFDDIIYQSDLSDGLHELKGSNGRYAAVYHLQESPYLMRRESFVAQKEARVITLDFNQYEKVDGFGLFPYLRTVEAFSPESGNTKVNISLSDIEINPDKTIRFEIPAHYKKI
jgi:hypothetical protein